jgi:hypothetical protein
MKLADNVVYVFGSNSTGFHGAGSAGMAFRGVSENTWREDQAFLKAMKSPVGSPFRIGQWAVFGVARGFQEGKEGKSYAIQTIERPGQRRSTPLSEIKKQLLELAEFARLHTEYQFHMTPVGAGLAGWKKEEMKVIWEEVKGQMPENVVYPNDLYEEVEIKNT